MSQRRRGRIAALVLSLLIVACSGVAWGQSDIIDLVLSSEANSTAPPTRCFETNAPFEQIDLSLIIRNPSLGGVSGWEGMVEFEGSLTAPSWTLRAGLDVDSAHDTNSSQRFQVGIGLAPLALTPNAAGNVVLATFSAFVLGPTDQVRFFIRPNPASTIFDPLAPGYAGPVSADTFAATSTYSGNFDQPVFWLNTPGCDPSPTPVFRVDVAAFNAVTEDAENALGTSIDALDGQDALDVPSAPFPPGDYVQLSFPHPEWSAPLGANFDQDFRAPFDETLAGMTWTMEVATDLVDLPVTLDFTMAVGWVQILNLRNHETGEFIRLHDVGMQYTYTPNPSGVNVFDVIVGAADVPELLPSVRWLTTGWNLVSMPLEPEVATLGAVILDDASGPAYALQHTTAGGYASLDGSDLLAQGHGYWLGATSDFIWRMEGAKDLGSIEIPLAPGWNLLGYPLWFSSHVNGITVLHQGTAYAWGDAVSAGLVDGSLQHFDGAAYQPVTALDAWHGYWLACYADGVILRFRWDEMPTTLQRPWDPYAALDDPDNWRLELSLAQGGQTLALGECVRAVDGFDAYEDRPRAPASPNDDGVSLYFPRAEWNLPTGAKVSGDIRAPSQGRARSWTARLESADADAVTLTWDRAAWGGTQDLELYLPQQNRVAVRSLRAVGSVTLAVGAEPLDLVFRTPQTSTGVDAPAFAASELRAVPNPFNPRTEIRFTSAAAGVAQVRVFDVAGRWVRTLDAGRVDAGAAAAVVWQGRDDAGRELASGAYFARLVMDGRPQGATARLSLVR
ncbi:MAG TPA: FlgD immunoglobulin-like domain containing protein [Candidatus Krumholzibacteria bacterium]|nr:FlgD immunoglobulin-like domain containing protein [Candidatus Krumholzibacteria bacterium]HRX52191.1 FlgD immunoglobulin-like domain containing protein [Candidatus Krumholzibacteria bacterium]